MTKNNIVFKTYAWRRKGSHRVCLVRRVPGVLFDSRLKQMNKRRLRNVRQWSQRLLNYYEKMRTMKFYKKKEQLEDERFVPVKSHGRVIFGIENPSCRLPDKILALEDNTSSKAKQPASQQNGIFNELRGPSATLIDAPFADDSFNLHHKANVGLTRNEKDFTCNSVFARNEMLSLNDLQGKKRQCTLRPKNYVDDIEEDLISEMSHSSEELRNMEAASAHPSFTARYPYPVQQKLSHVRQWLAGADNFDTSSPSQELNENFCGFDSHEGQVVAQEPMDTTLAHPEVATTSSKRRSEEVTKDNYQNLKAKPEPELKTKSDNARKETITVVLDHKLMPFPIEGCFLLCQWKYFLAAFDARNAFVWAVQTETSLLMAVTTVNQTPTIFAAKNCVNIRNAINQDALPLLALQILKRGWQKNKTKNRVVGMLGMAGYWHIKRLGNNLRPEKMAEISPFTVIPLNDMPTGMLPVPEKPPEELLIPGEERSIQTEPEPQPEPEPQYHEKVLLPTVEILDSDEEVEFPKLEIIDSDEEDLLSRLEILHSDKAELLSAVENFEESTAKDVAMNNKIPGMRFEPFKRKTNALNLSNSLPPKHDKPVILSVEYLPPQLPTALLNGSCSEHPSPPLLTNEAPQEAPTATTGALSITKLDAAGYTYFVPQKIAPPVAAPQLHSLETPREALKIYNRPNMPVNGQTLPSLIKPLTAKPVFIKKIPATGEATSSHLAAASTLASVSQMPKIYPPQNMPINIQTLPSQAKPMVFTPVYVTKIPAAGEASSSRPSYASTTSLGVHPQQAAASTLPSSHPSQLTNGQRLLVNRQVLGIKANGTLSSPGVGQASQKLPPKQAPTWTPTPIQAPTWTLTPKQASTWTPTPKQASTWTPTPKQASTWTPTPKQASTWTPTPVSVPLDHKKISHHGFMYANQLPAYPAWVQASRFIIQIPDCEAIIFKSQSDANTFLNKHLSRIPIFEGLVPADWKFMVRK